MGSPHDVFSVFCANDLIPILLLMIAKDSWMCMEEGIELNFKGAAQSSRESRVFFTFLSMLEESEFIVKNVSS